MELEEKDARLAALMTEIKFLNKELNSFDNDNISVESMTEKSKEILRLKEENERLHISMRSNVPINEDKIKDMKMSLIEAENLNDEKESMIRSLIDQQLSLKREISAALKNGLSYNGDQSCEQQISVRETPFLNEINSLKIELKGTQNDLVNQRSIIDVLKIENLKINDSIPIIISQTRTPLLEEINGLNQRIFDIEAQLREAWNSKNDMTSQLENYDYIKTLERKILKEEQGP